MSKRKISPSGRGAPNRTRRNNLKAQIDSTIRNIVDLMDQAETLAEYQLLLQQHFPRSPDETDFDPIDFYRETPRFLEAGFRLQKASKRTRHRLGGRSQSPAPVCAACNTPLIQFADLDARDKLLHNDYPFKRLPLYYCCSCPGPVYYRVTKTGDVEVLRSKRELYEEAPFENPPNVLGSGFLSIRKIGSEAEDAIFAAHKENGFETLSKSQRAAISSVLGRSAKGRWDVYFSQLGGLPLSYQGDEGKPGICPNTECKIRRRKREEHKYRPLAVLDLWNDHFWGIKPLDAVQIVYHICPGCFCISAKYTCT